MEFGSHFFFLFLGLSLSQFWLKIMQEWGFLIFCYFFQNFLPGVEGEQNSGLKFFLLFLGLSHPVVAKNNAGKGFLNFLNFFAIFFGIF